MLDPTGVGLEWPLTAGIELHDREHRGREFSQGRPVIEVEIRQPGLKLRPITMGAFSFPAQAATDRVLGADATLRFSGTINPDGSPGAGTSWSDIQGGYPVHHTSAHMDHGQPAGGNVLFLDAHVEWRNFKKMRLISQGTANPQFFW